MMGVETTTDSWFTNFWKTSSVSDPQKTKIGILAFEVATMMSKLIKLWQLVGETQIAKLREEISSSVGIQKLVSDDNKYLTGLVLAEIIHNLECLVTSVVRLGKRCSDPVYRDLERIFYASFEVDLILSVWQYRLKKMERKVKKMERFVAATKRLYEELEALGEQEQSLRQLRFGSGSNNPRLLEVQQKVIWQRQEVKNLQELSPWVRSYDYIVRLLLRSIFTVIMRIKFAFQINNEMKNSWGSNRAILQSSVYPYENNVSNSITGKPSDTKSRQLASVGSFGCMKGGGFSPALNEKNKVVTSRKGSTKKTFFDFKRELLVAPESTLGSSALALHYANIILLIEKLASSPQLICPDARDDLYDMLPSSLRASLRAKLKPISKKLASSTYNVSLAAKWSLALIRILEWLSPLAQNTVRWHSERNFEKHQMTCGMTTMTNVPSGTNVLLVQTLYFASKAKTETMIIELLIGLNCLCIVESSLSRARE